MIIKDSVYSLEHLNQLMDAGEWWLVCLEENHSDKKWLFWGKGLDPFAKVRYPNFGGEKVHSYVFCFEVIREKIGSNSCRFGREKMTLVSRMTPGGYAKQEVSVGGIPTVFRQKGIQADAEILEPRLRRSQTMVKGGAAEAFAREMEAKKGPPPMSFLPREDLEKSLIERGLGVYLKYYKIFCETENRWIEMWCEHDPDACPVEASHRIKKETVVPRERKFVLLESRIATEGEPLVMGHHGAVQVNRTISKEQIEEGRRQERRIKKSKVVLLMQKRKKTSDW